MRPLAIAINFNILKDSLSCFLAGSKGFLSDKLNLKRVEKTLRHPHKYPPFYWGPLIKKPKKPQGYSILKTDSYVIHNKKRFNRRNHFFILPANFKLFSGIINKINGFRKI